MKSIASKTNSSILVRSMIVLAVLIGSTAFLLSPPPTHADSVPFYSFSGYSDGAEPLGGLVQGSDGNFYGTTAGGGASGYGTVFKITVATNADQCKNGGWATYTSPRTFKNQGDCIQFVETGK